MTANLRLLGIVVTLMAGSPGPVHAIVGGTATTAFQAVGSGVQVTPDWVLTVQHALPGVGATYFNGYGERTVAAIYSAPGSGTFPANDFALMRLAPAAAAVPYIGINGDNFAASLLEPRAVTIASPANQSPRGYGHTTITQSIRTYDEDGPGPLPPVVVNWLLSFDDLHVQSGDSGGGLFLGHTTDSGMLLGLSSASIEDDDGVTIGSAFVQPAAYRSWIDATMAADPADDQALLWVRRVREPDRRVPTDLPLDFDVRPLGAVPEPASWALGLVGVALLAGWRARSGKA